MAHLDPDAVHAFVLVADLKSFTRAASALNSTQSAVSLKINRLESRLGKRLFERTPRLVRLSTSGELFLGPARALIAAYQQALGTFIDLDKPRRLAIGLSHHVVADDLPSLLRFVRDVDPAILLDVRVGSSRDLLDAYDQGELDAAIVFRHPESRRGGETLFADTFAWMAAPDFRWTKNEPLPLAIAAEPCKLRAMTLAALRDAQQPWREAFIGSSTASISGAAVAGFGVAAIAQRLAPAALVHIGATYGLPPLPSLCVILHSNLTDPRASKALRRLIDGFRQNKRPESPSNEKTRAVHASGDSHERGGLRDGAT
jgi:DNA-binding transcriptional LysR family regulator